MTSKTAPVRYGEHVRAKRGTPCLLCRATEFRPFTDHCHAHGWVRGPLCHRCNMLMISIDRGKAPRQSALRPPLTLAALAKHAARCPDCKQGAPITPNVLTRAVTDGKRFSVTLEVTDYEALRALAYADEALLAVKARDLIISETARAKAAKHVA